MAYKVSVKIGKGKNITRAESIALPNKERVIRYLKRCPIGNSATTFSVKDLKNKKVVSDKRHHFYNPDRW